MKRLKIVFIVCFSLTLMGCVAVKKSLDNYQACKGDAVCLEEMNKARATAYTVTKAATGPLLPSTSEVLAMIVSNVVSFGFGVFHGKKRG